MEIKDLLLLTHLLCPSPFSKTEKKIFACMLLSISTSTRKLVTANVQDIANWKSLVSSFYYVLHTFLLIQIKLYSLQNVGSKGRHESFQEQNVVSHFKWRLPRDHQVSYPLSKILSIHSWSVLTCQVFHSDYQRFSIHHFYPVEQ